MNIPEPADILTICGNEILRRMEENSTLRARVAELTIERDNLQAELDTYKQTASTASSKGLNTKTFFGRDEARIHILGDIISPIEPS